MESNVNITTAKSTDTEPQVQVVLWDFDGPTSNGGKIGEILDPPEDKKKWPKYFDELESKHPNLKIYRSEIPAKVAAYSIYIDNLDLLKATLSILHNNNIKSVVASQRTTFGFGYEFVADVLEAMHKGEPWPEGPVDSEKYRQAIATALANIEGGDKITDLILNYLSGKITPKDAQNLLKNFSSDMKETNEQYKKEEEKNEGEKAKIYTTYLDLVIDTLRIKQSQEEDIRHMTFENLNMLLGSDRPFLLQKEAETVGRTVALQGIPTSKNKFSYTAALNQVPSYEHLTFDQENGKNALLVDDHDYSKNFPPGMFIEAPRHAKATPDEDNAYLAQVLLKSVPFPKLLEDLARYEDKQAAEQLLKLVIVEKLKEKNVSQEQLAIELLKIFSPDLILKLTSQFEDKQAADKLLTAIFKERLSVFPFTEILKTLLTCPPDTVMAAASSLMQANSILNAQKALSKQATEIIEASQVISDLVMREVVTSKLITSAIIEKSKTTPIKDILTSLQKDSIERGYIKESLPYVIEAYANGLKNNNNLSDKDKKAELKKFVKTIIEWLNNTADLGDSIVISKIIDKLKDEKFDDLLRLETGGHKKFAEAFASITKKEVEKHGMTTTWSDIIDTAKNQVEKNIKGVLSRSEGGIKISKSADEAFRELFGMRSGRFAPIADQMGKLLSHVNVESKPKQLVDYEKLYSPEQGGVLRQPSSKQTEKKKFT